MKEPLGEQEQNILYEKYSEFCDNQTFEKVLDKLRHYNGDNKELYLDFFIDDLVKTFTRYYRCYDADFFKNESHYIDMFIKAIECDKTNRYTIIKLFFTKSYGKLTDCIKKNYNNFLGNEKEKYADKPIEELEIEWTQTFFDVYKNAYPGFWLTMADGFRIIEDERSAILSEFAEKFYAKYEDVDATITTVLDFQRDYPEFVLPDSLLAELYYRKGMWHNAIAYYEKVVDKSFLLYSVDCYFNLAWAYDKVKDYKSSEEWYRKTLTLCPDVAYALNNLGWSLSKQKRYAEAEEIFKQCIEEERDFPYACNNLVNVLIKQGKYKEAHEFADSGKYKISKIYLNKLAKLPFEDNTKVIETEAVSFEKDDSDSEEKTSLGNSKSNIANAEQFSSEAILETELVNRLEKGYEVFGMKLKIYQRKGDLYGRQYVCNNGKMRFDILCEDENGDFYIVELKKDSGYDDAYEQTAQYIDWFAANKAPKGKKTYGIICLNSPTEVIKAKVRKDKRIKLFEYKVSYEEVK